MLQDKKTGSLQIMKEFITLALGCFIFNFAVVFSSTYFCFRQLQTNYCAVSMPIGDAQCTPNRSVLLPFRIRRDMEMYCRGDRDNEGVADGEGEGDGDGLGDGDGQGEGERDGDVEGDEGRQRYVKEIQIKRDKQCPLRHLTTQAKFRLKVVGNEK